MDSNHEVNYFPFTRVSGCNRSIAVGHAHRPDGDILRQEPLSLSHDSMIMTSGGYNSAALGGKNYHLEWRSEMTVLDFTAVFTRRRDSFTCPTVCEHETPDCAADEEAGRQKAARSLLLRSRFGRHSRNYVSAGIQVHVITSLTGTWTESRPCICF